MTVNVPIEDSPIEDSPGDDHNKGGAGDDDDGADAGDSLSSGAVAGIAIGAAFVGSLVGASATMLYWHYHPPVPKQLQPVSQGRMNRARMGLRPSKQQATAEVVSDGSA